MSFSALSREIFSILEVMDLKEKNTIQTITEATVAPGIDDEKGLELEASNEDIKKGNTTKVTILSYDEVDHS